ncbi:MAG: flagellar filament capping protein FliD [bacterium]|nr:flagellar filament capping protein FliD [bacterium]
MTNGNGISFSGLASGLDTQAIVAQLVSLERIPIGLLEARKEEEQSRLDVLGNFKSLVEALQSSADTLSSSSSFFDYSVGLSEEGFAAISATSSAPAGSHTIDVDSLASIDRWAFDGVADPTTALASGAGEEIKFTVGSAAYTVGVDPAASSLNDIAALINGEAGEAVTASVVNTGTESSPSYQLVLASIESGADSRIGSIVNTVSGLTIDPTGPDGAGNSQSANNITVGANAVAIIDGLRVERTNNDFSDVIEGVSIDLLSTTDAAAGGEVSFTIEADREALRANIDEFVDAYNGVVDFINRQSTYTPSDDEDGNGTVAELFGDNILRRVKSEISSSIFNVDIGVVQADTEGFSTLSLIGISQSNDGTLTIDDTVFDEKLSENIDAIADLFVDSDGFDNGGVPDGDPGQFIDTTADSGLAATLMRSIDRMLKDIPTATGSVPGIFESSEDAIRGRISDFDDRIEAMERRLEGFEESLILRFARLEELMGGLNAQGAALSSVLAGLSPQ